MWELQSSNNVNICWCFSAMVIVGHLMSHSLETVLAQEKRELFIGPHLCWHSPYSWSYYFFVLMDSLLDSGCLPLCIILLCIKLNSISSCKENVHGLCFFPRCCIDIVLHSFFLNNVSHNVTAGFSSLVFYFNL